MTATARPAARMASAQARVTANEPVRGGCHRLELRTAGAFPETGPGQFVMLSTEHPNFPILPRPFSVLGWRPLDGAGVLEFLVMPVGIGSALLCSLLPGETAQVVGPLGHRLDDDLPQGPLVCVAGGYGVAPFLFLVEAWARAGDPRLADTTVIFGARTAERLSLSERLLAAGCRVELCTDDGSEGFAGRVDGRLSEILSAQRAGLVLACGPEPMMEAVGATARLANVPARASLETVMGCGYAVCNGCAVAVSDARAPDGYTYELACREGTIFDEARLHWNLL